MSIFILYFHLVSLLTVTVEINEKHGERDRRPPAESQIMDITGVWYVFNHFIKPFPCNYNADASHAELPH